MPAPIDVIPDTPTARALSGHAATSEPGAIQATERKPSRETTVDPDAANSPVCSGKKYIVVDPDDPNAPVCSGKRYIIAPDPGQRALADELPAWARTFAETLAESRQ